MLTLFIAVSVSIDSFITGLSLGIKKIRISPAIYLLISFMFLFYAFMGYTVAHFFLSFFAENVRILTNLELAGNLSIILLGGFFLARSIKQNRKNKNDFLNSAPEADFDNSGVLDCFEALALSLILSVDTIVAVISVALSENISPLQSLIFGFLQAIFLAAGLGGGRLINFKKFFNSAVIDYLPGFILILAGILRLI